MSSVLGVTDLVFGDVLTEVGMKPRWETFRGYAFAVTVAATLLMTDIVTPAPSVQCLPLTENATIIAGYTVTSSKFVNICCVKRGEGILEYSGFAAVIFTAAIFVVSSYWLLDPGVIKAYRVVHRVENLMDGLRLTLQDLKEKALIPGSLQDDQRVMVTEILDLIWQFPSINLKRTYKKRSFRLFVAVFASLVWSATCLHFAYTDSRTYICSLEEHFSNTNNVALSPASDFSCAYDLPAKLLSFLWVFVFSAAAQVIFILCGLYKAFHIKDGQGTREAPGGQGDQGSQGDQGVDASMKTAWKDASFVKLFWKDSKPMREERLWDFIKYSLSQNQDVKDDYYKRFAWPGNPSLFALAEIRSTVNEKRFLKKARLIAEHPHFAAASQEYVDIVKSLNAFHYLESEAEMADLIHVFIEKKHWEALVCLLDSTDELPDAAQKEIKSLNLYEIGQPYKNQSSILFHALKEPTIKANAIHHLDTSCDDKRKRCVYYQGGCTASETFTNDREYINERKKSTVLSLLQKNEPLEEADFTFPENTLAGNYRLTDTEMEESDIRAVAKYVSRRPFLTWSDGMKAVAKKAYDNKHWILFVEILNSLSPLSEEIPVQQTADWGFTNFILDREDGRRQGNGSILYYAMRKPDYRQKFVSTAKDYILSHDRGGEKWVWDEGGSSGQINPDLEHF